MPEFTVRISLKSMQIFLTKFRQLIAGIGIKGVDIVAIASNKTDSRKRVLWLIEVKDYRAHTRTKPSELAHEVAAKVRDSLAGLFVASMRANDTNEKKFAQPVLKSSAVRIVLHLEQPTRHSRLFPQVVDPSNIQKKLRKLLKGVDPHVQVVDLQNHGRWVSWTAT